MNHESACAFEENSLKTETLSFNKIPRQSALFLDFQADAPGLEKFYPEKQTPLKTFAEKVLSAYKIDRNALCDVLVEINANFKAEDAKTFENIALLREKNCLAVVTGQQAGLFSGSLYAVYKALSAVKLCEELKKQNVNAVPIFWIAEEDHDFDEVKKTFVPGKKFEPPTDEFNLIEIENTPKRGKQNLPVGLIDLDETISETIEKLLKDLPRTEFTARIGNLLFETYRPEETYGGAFAKFLAKIFAGYGLIFLAPLNKKLKKLCAPIFAAAIENSDKINSALLRRNDELKDKNYSPQILATEDSFPFFYLNESGERLALRRDLRSGKIKAQKSETEFDKETLKNVAENEPRRLSPNALMRPVVQDYLLPTLVYFGGAAEIAYFAQNSVIYKILERPATPIQHRASFTIIEAKHARTLEKYRLSFADLFKGKETVLAETVERFLNNKAAREFAEVEEIINAQLNRLDRHLLASEPTLSANLANRRRKIIWHIGALRKKYHRAEIFKHEVARRRIEALFITLLPHNALQERTLNVVTFLNLYGENFIDWIYEAIDTNEKDHQILYL